MGKHGGKREGAGRKRVGITKKVSISLPHGDWERFDEVRGDRSRSEFLRELILKELDS
ncbi:CopG family transcriptional regulator [Bacillus badius]|nr:CopG family transcriptional regulator [Bacillus badius]